jgi:hypothetical protein
MTQSHLPRTGRGVTEAVNMVVRTRTSLWPAFSQEEAGFLFSTMVRIAY